MCNMCTYRCEIWLCFLSRRRPQTRSTRTDTLRPYPSRFRTDVEDRVGCDRRQTEGGDVAGIGADCRVHLLIDALWLQRHLVEVRLTQHVLLAMLSLPLPGAAVLQLALCLPLSRHRDEVLQGRLGVGDDAVVGHEDAADLGRR